jgi:tetratricopeptide (TPR) repeat protein
LLLGRVCFYFINNINNLEIEDAYDEIYQVWTENQQSPSLSASLAYLLSKYNPESIPPSRLILDAYKKAADNYYVLIFGYRLFLENELISDKTILEFAASGEKYYSHDLILLQNLTDIYVKTENYEKAYQINKLVLEQNPKDVRGILRQLELVHLTGRSYQQEWIKNLLENLMHDHHYSQAFYQRAINILTVFEKFPEAQKVFCLGQVAGYESSQLLGDNPNTWESDLDSCQ